MGKIRLKRLNFNTMIKGEKPVSKDARQIVSQNESVSLKRESREICRHH